MLLRQAPSRLAVMAIIGVDAIDRVHRLLHRGEAEKTFARRDGPVKSCVLRHDRLAAGQIACSALAEPSTAQANILVFGDGEFTARSSEIVRIAPKDIHRHLEWLNEPPT